MESVRKAGAFVRKDAGFRNWVRRGGGAYEPEAGRYHLYVSYACPWASRCVAVRALKGLETAIPMSVVCPTWQKTRPGDEEDLHHGWVFADWSDAPLQSPGGHGAFSREGATVDKVNGRKTIREIYEACHDTMGTYSVPILYDTKTSSIVSNESSEIVQMFNSEFDDFAENPSLNLLPTSLGKEMQELDQVVYEKVNNGVYKCGYAKEQEPYQEAVDALFETLDKLEAMLSSTRYLFGDTLTMSDIRLFVTLIRFDHVYFVHFKASKKLLREYPSLFAYTRDIYQSEKVASSVNFRHIVDHYYSSHPKNNYCALVPPCTTDFTLPHTRDTVGSPQA